MGGHYLAMLLFTLCLPVSLALDIVVPAYIYPEGQGLKYWNQMVASASKVSLTVILNPNSGPDARAADVDPTLVGLVKQLRAKGGKVIGYVYSQGGKRNLSKVYSDVDKYISYYPIDGIFVDEMSNDAKTVGYYKSLYTYIKGKNPTYTVMNNPGTTIPETFLSNKVADRFCTYESPQKDYKSYEQENYHNSYPASTYVHIVYGATAEQMTTDIKTMVSLNIGGVFVSNDVLPNPYDILPPYWDQLVATVASYKSG